jgi:hypothetical protein
MDLKTLKVLIDVIQRKLLRASLEYHGNLPCGSHALLQQVAEFIPVLSISIEI